MFFFEFGIRTALDKPLALVKDDQTINIPFDASIIHCYTYKSIPLYDVENQVLELSTHISSCAEQSNGRNSLWKYFGISQAGNYAPEEVEVGEKLDFLSEKIDQLNMYWELLIETDANKNFSPSEVRFENEIGLIKIKIKAVDNKIQKAFSEDNMNEYFRLVDQRNKLTDIGIELRQKHWELMKKLNLNISQKENQ